MLFRKNSRSNSFIHSPLSFRDIICSRPLDTELGKGAVLFQFLDDRIYQCFQRFTVLGLCKYYGSRLGCKRLTDYLGFYAILL